MRLYIRNIVVFVPLFGVCAWLTACDSCRGSRSGGESGEETAAETPTPTPTPEPADDIVGSETPPITTDGVASIDTTAGAALKHLIFESSSTTIANRHTSEFLMVVHSLAESCVRFKVRPTEGPSQELDPADLVPGEGSETECGAAITPEEEPAAAEESTEESEGGGEESGSEEGGEAALTFFSPHRERGSGFGLAGPDLPLCSNRLFRMRDENNSVHTKVGWLKAIGPAKKIRVWLDEEYAPSCPGDRLNSLDPVEFAELAVNAPAQWENVFDKLREDHLENLAAEMEKIYTKITADFGPIGDIDSSGHVEIFLSPDVNRYRFVKHHTATSDHFRPRWIYQPQDLAFYDGETNPVGNEGEVIYLWTPDPAGLYTDLYPSANSITSNHAKGYLTAQLMNLIILNEKVFTQKSAPEASWLTQGLSYLAASYYAGNDFPKLPLAQYLTSRPQILSLTQTLGDLEGYSAAQASDEQAGLRAMFGWYLHTRLCGTNVQPCLKVKELITSQKRGRDVVTEIIGEDFDTVLDDYGLTVGIALLDDPTAALAFWDSPGEGYPQKPKAMPDLTEIFADDPPQTFEVDNAGDPVGGSADDRTQAGPFPSKGALIYQTVTSDSDLEFKTVQDSVTFVLLTGLLDASTDVTAFFGKGLKVAFIPAGDLDLAKRKIFFEKVSESAHLDLRPTNLTKVIGNDYQLNTNERQFDNDLATPRDFTVTSARELWILGSIEKLKVPGDGGEVSDSDSYIVPVKPCEGLSGAELATCEGGNVNVAVQVVIRDYQKELTPMLLATANDRGIFRGHSIYGVPEDFNLEVPELGEDAAAALCESAISFPDNPAGTPTVTFTAADPANFHFVGHGYSDGQAVQFSTTDPVNKFLPRDLKYFSEYYVKTVDADNFTLQDAGGNDLAFGLWTFGNHTANGTAAAISIANPAVVTQAGHGLSNNDEVRLGTDGRLPGFSEQATYYADVIDVNTFRICQIPNAGSGCIPLSTVETPIDLGVIMVYSGDPRTCANAGYTGAKVYDDNLTFTGDQTTGGTSLPYMHNYFNYLYAGPRGFPFTTRHSIFVADRDRCDIERCYEVEERNGQFLDFSLNRQDPITWHYFPVATVSSVTYIEYLSPDTLSEIADLKSRIENCPVSDPQSDESIDACAQLANLSASECISICGPDGADIDAKMRSYFRDATDLKGVQCSNVDTCEDLVTVTNPGNWTTAWVPHSRASVLAGGGAFADSDTYYTVPVRPDHETSPYPASLTSDYCIGRSAAGNLLGHCPIKQGPGHGDIRNQLHLEWHKWGYGGCTLAGGTHEACVDGVSYDEEIREEGDVFHVESFPLSTDRNLVRAQFIAERAVEVTGKPQRLQTVFTQVPGNQETMLNVIVGGRDLSEGQYLIRVRTFTDPD